MKITLSVLILSMLAAIIYLVVDRANVPTDQAATADDQDRKPQSERSIKLLTQYVVRQLIDASKHLSEQIEAIRSLPADLTEEEYAALIDLLHQSSPNGVRPNTWTTLQNEIMEVLRSDRFDWKGYAPAMAEILLDKGADPIMRDYAAQHLVLYLGDHAKTLSKDQLDQSFDALLAVLQGNREARHQVIGTTLMALCNLNTRHSQLLDSHRPVLAQTIKDLLGNDKSITMSNQIAAIQAAGRLRFEETLPMIRQFAKGEAPNASARLSSIAALGYFADPTDKSFLENLANSQSKLRFAAKTALKKY